MSTLAELVGAHPVDYSFDQLMRLARQVGDDLPRLRTELRLGHPPGDVATIRQGPDGRPELVLACFGLAGPVGTMPWHLTGRLLAERREGETALHEFLDMLTARLAALLHLGWRRGAPAVAHEAGDPAAHLPLLALAGLATHGMAGRIHAGEAGMDEDGLARQAILLGLATRPAEGLERLLADHFGHPVTVRQFHGGWMDIPAASRLRLGDGRRLGDHPACGSRCWEARSRLAIDVGPVPRAALRRLTRPGTDAPLARARRLTGFYLGSGFEIELRFLLAGDAIEGAHLDCRAAPEKRSRLGIDTWLAPPREGRLLSDTRFRWPAASPTL